MLNEEVLKEAIINVTSRHPNFDRACEEVLSRAGDKFEIDQCGNSKISGWERSCCSIEVIFDSYEAKFSMTGHEHIYTFVIRAVKVIEKD